MKLVNKGVTAILPFNIFDASGALKNATSLPIIKRVMVNGAITTVASTSVEQQQDATPANITGRYQVKIPTSSMAFNDQVQVEVEATIDGVTLADDLMFTVINSAESRPRIDTL